MANFRSSRSAISLCLLLLLLSACAEHRPTVQRTTAAVAPRLGKADALDSADRSCRVVLRELARPVKDGGFETDCTSGSCRYVWRGTVDLAAALDAVLAVRVLYRRSGQASWWSVDAQLSDAISPGFKRYRFAISEHLFGPGDPDAEIEVVALVEFADGRRLFDHNRFSDDHENLRLTAQNGHASQDTSACQSVVGRLTFHDDWATGQYGQLRQGGFLWLEYDIDRLSQCRGTHNGYPAWDIVATLRFSPGGQVVKASVRQLLTNHGIPTNVAVDLPLVTTIPQDATTVEIWFHNASGAGSSCQAWDSNYGANYRFAIQPDANDPRCLDVEKETGAVTEDPRMVHMADHCLGYTISAQYAATHCEFTLGALGDGKMGHYGIPYHWLVAYLNVAPQEGELLNVGLYTQFQDKLSGLPGQRFSLGVPVAPGVWRTGVTTRVAQIMQQTGVERQIDALAFFIDVRRPSGEVVRLWHSDGGQNFRRDTAFSLPNQSESIPYGTIFWANSASAVFSSTACE